MRQTIRYMLVLSVIALVLPAITITPAEARKFTITQREERLAHAIDRAERTGELTLKEANSLRRQQDSILRLESRMKAENGGRLSYANIRTLEGKLNKVSNKLHAKQLAKRVDAPVQ